MPLTTIAILAAATALTPADEQDVRCLAAFSTLAGQADANLQEAGKIGAMFYVGRLKGRSPGLDLEAAMRVAMPTFEKNAQADMVRCGTELGSVGMELTTLGKALEKTP